MTIFRGDVNVMVIGEIKMWRAVIATAINDAVNPKLYETGYEALEWIYHGGIDFELVCEFAGVSPNAVRKELLRRRVIMEK
jgi:predicted HTH domain antitoxin